MKNGLILRNGAKYHYQNDLLHRIDGPAVEYSNGDKEWYKHGKLHREDGPAVDFINGIKCYYLNDKYISNINSQEEFERYIKLTAFT